MTSRNYSVEQSNVNYRINEILFTKSLSSETKCNQKVIIHVAIQVIKAGLRKLISRRNSYIIYTSKLVKVVCTTYNNNFYKSG